MMPAWLLPEYVEDLLPREARRLEALRARLLALFDRQGYNLVEPPLIEFLDALLPENGNDLDLKTIKFVDAFSGRQVGVRADITPQAARIDAHLLGHRAGVTRLCYAGSVLHARPDGLLGNRQPYQIGAELYGHAGLDADREILALLLTALETCDLANTRVSLGHAGLFQALTQAAGVDPQREAALFSALRGKDVPRLEMLCADLPAPWNTAFVALTDLYGDAAVIDQARACLPDVDGVAAKLDELATLANGAATRLGIDLADLRGYGYHNGIVFAAYVGGQAQAIALGGRYDGVGQRFGRSRPATGFSLDLRQIVNALPEAAPRGGILAPCANDSALNTEIHRLRDVGERVVIELPGQQAYRAESGCDRILIQSGPAWQVRPLVSS